MQLLAFIAVFDFCTALRMSIQNLNSRDPFADAIKGPDDDIQDGLVHIRIQQRNGRKTLTTVQGLSAEYDLKKIVRSCKKEFACNGTVIEHPEYGEVLQLQGDQRENICQWLTKVGLAKADRLKVHGFWVRDTGQVKSIDGIVKQRITKQQKQKQLFKEEFNNASF